MNHSTLRSGPHAPAARLVLDSRVHLVLGDGRRVLREVLRGHVFAGAPEVRDLRRGRPIRPCRKAPFNAPRAPVCARPCTVLSKASRIRTALRPERKKLHRRPLPSPRGLPLARRGPPAAHPARRVAAGARAPPRAAPRGPRGCARARRRPGAPPGPRASWKASGGSRAPAPAWNKVARGVLRMLQVV